MLDPAVGLLLAMILPTLAVLFAMVVLLRLAGILLRKHLPVGLRLALGLPVDKGEVGEHRVRQVLEQHRPEGARILDDVTLRLPDGSTTQIDHLLLGPAGCFCIETKNIDGWIFGSATQTEWTISNHRRKHRFRNPLHQNFGHLKALETVSGIEPEALHGAVVFASGAEFKKGRPPGVLMLDDLAAWIAAPRPAIWDAARIAAVAARIEELRLPVGVLTDWRHVRGLKRKHGAGRPAASPKATPIAPQAAPSPAPAIVPPAGTALPQPPPPDGVPSSKPSAAISATQLAKKHGLKVDAVFRRLQAAGWIARSGDKWELTEAGRAAGGCTAKSHWAGEHIAWPEDIRLPE